MVALVDVTDCDAARELLLRLHLMHPEIGIQLRRQTGGLDQGPTRYHPEDRPPTIEHQGLCRSALPLDGGMHTVLDHASPLELPGPREAAPG